VTGHVIHVGHISDVYKISFRKPERNRFQRNRMEKLGVDASASGLGPVASSYKFSNEPWFPLKAANFLHSSANYILPSTD